MNLTAKLLLIPSWMLDKINKEGENVSILKDLTKLSNIFTVEDVAFYISINNIFNTYGNQWEMLFQDTLNTFLPTDIYNMTEDSLTREPVTQTLKGGLTAEEYLDRVKKRSDAQLMMKEIVSDLDITNAMQVMSKVTRSNNNANIYVFTLAELSENVFGLIVKSLNAKEVEEYKEKGHDLYGIKSRYNLFLETLSKFYQISELSQTELFKSYVLLESE